MDGKQTAFHLTRHRSRVAFCIVGLAGLCVSIATAQTPRQLDAGINAHPIEQAPSPDEPPVTLRKTRARLISARGSTFTATLTAAKMVADSGESTDPDLPSAWTPNTATAGPPKAARTVDEALETRGTVTFRKTPISEVVFLLSDLWQINIVAGETVSGEVSGAFHDAPLSEVLAAVLTSSGYSYRKTGSSLVVLSADQIGVNDPSFVSDTLSLPPSLRDDASTLEAAQMLLSERGQLKKIGTDLILVIDRPDRIERVRSLFASLSPSYAPADASTIDTTMTNVNIAPMAGPIAGISYFKPQFTEASELAEPLRVALGSNVVASNGAIGSVIVAVYPQENRIMVKGTPSELALAAEIIAQLDKPRQQVRITAMIYDVGISELEKLGVNWSRDVRAIANGRNELLENVTESVSGFYTAASDLTTSGVSSVGIRTITGNLEASVFLEALDSNSEAKLLADPSITVGDRRQASIRIVRKIPIVGANPVNNSNAVFTQTEFEEAGVILNVQPRISSDGTIELIVQPEYSVVAEVTSTGPVIDSRTAETIVRVANGHTFVLGGLRQTSITESKRGVPFLRDIKYVGALFRSHNTEVRESELIVFLKPEIISPYYGGSAREQAAACVANTQLDAIPYATVCPMTDCCKDPYCPNHHPRPRVNAGSIGLHMIGGDGLYDEYLAPQSGSMAELLNAADGQPNECVYPLAQPRSAEDGRNVTVPDHYAPVHVESPIQ